MKDMIALRKGHVESASDGWCLDGAMVKEGNDLLEDNETNGHLMKKQTMDDAETRRDRRSDSPKGDGNRGRRHRGDRRRQGEKRWSFCEQRKRDESTDWNLDEPDASHKEVHE
jgi:hypothetical protein